MERKIGTVSRGIRGPIIREGDDLAQIVTDSVLEAAEQRASLSCMTATWSPITESDRGPCTGELCFDRGDRR